MYGQHTFTYIHLYYISLYHGKSINICDNSVLSVPLKDLGLKGQLADPLSPSPPCQQELGLPSPKCERAKQRWSLVEGTRDEV